MRVPHVHVDIDAGREPLRRGIEKGFGYITFLMAASMLIYCIAGIQYNIDAHKTILYCIGLYGIPVVCSALIIADRHRSIFFAVGLFAISLAFSRVVRYYQWIHYGNNVMYVAGLILTILALNMMYSGFRYVSGNSRSITTILMSAFFFTIVMSIEVYLGYRLSPDNTTFIRDYGNSVAAIVMYIIYIGLVWSEPIRKSTELEKISRTLTGFRVAEGAGPNAYIHRDVAQTLVSFIADGNPTEDYDSMESAELMEAPEVPDESEEEESQGVVASILSRNKDEDEINRPTVYSEYLSKYTVKILQDGPVYAEMKFDFNDGLIQIYATLQKWTGPDGPSYISFSDHTEGSMLDVRPLRILHASIEGTDLIMEYSGGIAGKFTIRHVEDGPVRRVRSQGAA